MTKSKNTYIETAIPVIAVLQDKAHCLGGVLVNRTSACDIGKYWVYYSDKTESFLTEQELQKQLFEEEFYAPATQDI